MIKRRILFIIRDILINILDYSNIDYQLDFYYKEDNEKDFINLELYLYKDIKYISIYFENRKLIIKKEKNFSNKEEEIKEIKIF